MDWSKSKSIFIVVFLILNVFLYSLYLNRHTEAQQFEVLGEKKIESRLKDDNITISNLPTNIEAVSYISAKVKDFSKENLKLQNSNIEIEDNYKLIVTLKEPVKIKDPTNKASFNEFLLTNVYNGSSYVLWKIDEEENKALFFQRINDKTLYYNKNGNLYVKWNDDHEIVAYELTMFEKVKQEEKRQLLQPIEIIQVLYSKGLLKQNSEITDMTLGYSTPVQLTQINQVFVPTWAVQVQFESGKVDEYFVNATNGKIIDVQRDLKDVEDDIEKIEEMNEIKMEVSKE